MSVRATLLPGFLRLHSVESFRNAIRRDQQRCAATFGGALIGSKKSFTARYSVDRLVYFETFSDVVKAIAREKQIKGWRREKKIVVIKSTNPSWKDLRPELMHAILL